MELYANDQGILDHRDEFVSRELAMLREVMDQLNRARTRLRYDEEIEQKDQLLKRLRECIDNLEVLERRIRYRGEWTCNVADFVRVSCNRLDDAADDALVAVRRAQEEVGSVV